MKKLFILLSSILALQANAQTDYYWVGGSGDWSDVNHWATTSGGSTLHATPPTELDNVYFDNNSFTESGQAVVADGDIYCHDMDWTQMTAFDINLNPADYSNDHLYLSGSYLASSRLNSGLFRVYLTSTEDEIVSGTGRLAAYLNTDGTGKWVFTDDPNLTGINMNAGTIEFTAPEVTIRFFDINNTVDAKKVDLTDVVGHFNYLRIAESDLASMEWVGTNSTVTIEDELENVAGVTFEHVKFVTGSGSGIEVPNTTTYGTMEFEPGTTVRFGEGTTHTATNLIVQGTKFDQISISSQTAGAQATFSVASGTVDGDYLYIQDIAATGGATFNASNSSDLGNNTGWNITAPTPLSYYWIGGEGDWAELTNWSTTSGGTADHTSLPGSVDNIFFDANSFTAENQIVSMDSEDYGFNDLMIDVPFAVEFSKSGSAYVGVYGSVDISGPADIYTYLEFRSASAETISLGTATIRKIQFNGTGTWTFMSGGLIDDDVNLKSGNIDFNEQSVEFNSFYLQGDFGEDFPKSIDASNAELTVNGSFVIGLFSSDFTADFSGSTIHQYGTSFQGFNDQNTSDDINDIVFHDIKIYDQVEFRGNYEFNDIEIISGGISTKKGQGSDILQLQFNNLTGTGTIEDPIVLESLDDGVQCDYISKNALDITMEYVSIRDSKASGATFTATNSTDNGNNNGWTIQAPPDVPESPVLTMSTINETETTISWSAVANADLYKIELATSNTFTTIRETQEIAETMATFTNLSPATFYYVRGSARNEGGYSSLSATVELLTVPDAPDANDAFSVTTDAFTASWDNSTGEVDSYHLDVSTDMDFATFLEGYEDLAVASNTQRVEGLTEDGVYYYRVRASNASGTSVNSSTITVSTSVRTDQTITFEAIPAKTFGDAPFMVSATASSGLDITYESANTNIATVDGNEVTIVGVGEVNITAFQAGDEEYKAATPVSQLLVVNKADQTITFEAIAAKTFGDEPFTVTASTTSGLDVTFESDDTDIATVSGNEITILAAGEVNITASQAGDEEYNAATAVSQLLVVNKADQIITFEAISDLSIGDVITLSASSTSGLEITFTVSEGNAEITGDQLEAISDGSVTVVASQAGNDNYNAAEDASQTFTIVPDPLGLEDGLVSVYPNPVANTLYFNTTQALDVKMYGLDGSVVLSKQEVRNKVDLESLNSGTYILEVSNGSEVLRMRIRKIN